MNWFRNARLYLLHALLWLRERSPQLSSLVVGCCYSLCYVLYVILVGRCSTWAQWAGRWTFEKIRPEVNILILWFSDTRKNKEFRKLSLLSYNDLCWVPPSNKNLKKSNFCISHFCMLLFWWFSTQRQLRAVTFYWIDLEMWNLIVRKFKVCLLCKKKF